MAGSVPGSPVPTAAPIPEAVPAKAMDDGASERGKISGKDAPVSVNVRSDIMATALFLGKIEVGGTGKVTIPWTL